mmetsp:Transcript_19583/g.54452  ORF Transcript_19583/g.54452 Transcript_19583/m.54452 type:complete len:119 (-) Transcript_19583:34-390(-)
MPLLLQVPAMMMLRMLASRAPAAVAAAGRATRSATAPGPLAAGAQHFQFGAALPQAASPSLSTPLASRTSGIAVLHHLVQALTAAMAENALVDKERWKRLSLQQTEQQGQPLNARLLR